MFIDRYIYISVCTYKCSRNICFVFLGSISFSVLNLNIGTIYPPQKKKSQKSPPLPHLQLFKMCDYEYIIYFHKHTLCRISDTKELKGQKIKMHLPQPCMTAKLITICCVLFFLIKASNHMYSLEQLDYERLQSISLFLISLLIAGLDSWFKSALFPQDKSASWVEDNTA